MTQLNNRAHLLVQEISPGTVSSRAQHLMEKLAEPGYQLPSFQLDRSYMPNAGQQQPEMQQPNPSNKQLPGLGLQTPETAQRLAQQQQPGWFDDPTNRGMAMAGGGAAIGGLAGSAMGFSPIMSALIGGILGWLANTFFGGDIASAWNDWQTKGKGQPSEYVQYKKAQAESSGKPIPPAVDQYTRLPTPITDGMTRAVMVDGQLKMEQSKLSQMQGQDPKLNIEQAKVVEQLAKEQDTVATATNKAISEYMKNEEGRIHPEDMQLMTQVTSETEAKDAQKEYADAKKLVEQQGQQADSRNQYGLTSGMTDSLFGTGGAALQEKLDPVAQRAVQLNQTEKALKKSLEYLNMAAERNPERYEEYKAQYDKVKEQLDQIAPMREQLNREYGEASEMHGGHAAQMGAAMLNPIEEGGFTYGMNKAFTPGNRFSSGAGAGPSLASRGGDLVSKIKASGGVRNAARAGLDAAKSGIANAWQGTPSGPKMQAIKGALSKIPGASKVAPLLRGAGATGRVAGTVARRLAAPVALAEAGYGAYKGMTDEGVREDMRGQAATGQNIPFASDRQSGQSRLGYMASEGLKAIDIPTAGATAGTLVHDIGTTGNMYAGADDETRAAMRQGFTDTFENPQAGTIHKKISDAAQKWTPVQRVADWMYDV